MAVPVLAALNDEEPLGRIGTEGARQALRGEAEVDGWVRDEIELAIAPVAQ